MRGWHANGSKAPQVNALLKELANGRGKVDLKGRMAKGRFAVTGIVIAEP